MRLFKGSRVVGRIISGLKFFKVTARFGGSLADQLKKFLGGDVRGTRTGDKNAGGRQMADTQCRQFAVGANGPGALPLALGQRGRVKHHQIELAYRIFSEPLEGLRLDKFVPARSDGGIRQVEREVSLRAGQGVRAKIQVRHRPRAAAGGIKGKTSRKTESVQTLG